MSQDRNIAEKIQSLKEKIPKECTLVAVSKTKPNELILRAYESGHRDFGENKVQELVAKAEQLPQDINWHMIGHLQRNKVKYIAPFVHLIHGVDSLKLLKEIHKQGIKNDRIIDCLLQVHIADEETKFGFSIDELLDLFGEDQLSAFTNVKIRGLMGMATNTPNRVKVLTEFKRLSNFFNSLTKIKKQNMDINILSMGMSNDYPLAIEAGSTMIRIGSVLFGKRN